MKTLLVQDYLRSGKSLEDLKLEHGINYYNCNGKISLTYDMIEAKDSDLLSQQCRGLVVREGSYDIVAYPFNRFFNYEQTGLAPKDFNWHTATYEEKADGTLIIVYFDNMQDKWYCATRSRPEADGNIDNGDLTFAKLVDITIKRQLKGFENLNDFMSRAYDEKARAYTFCFELTSPINRIVVKYDEPTLTLLAVRHNLSLNEFDPDLWVKPSLGLESSFKYSFNDVNNMVEVIRSWNPEQHEGVVVKDHNFNRIKVKNPSYVAFNRMRDSLSTSFRGCVEVILLGKDDDVVGMMPDMIADRIRKIKPLVQEIFIQTEKDFIKLKKIENMKEFALEAQKCLWPDALFALKRGKTSDLKAYAFGNSNFNGINIPNSATDKILSLCKKIDNSFETTI